VEIHRGLIPRQAAAQLAADTASATARGEAPPANEPQLAESMVRRLTAHKTIAIQAGLLANADAALAVLAHALLAGIWHDERQSGGLCALHVSASEKIESLDRLGFNDVSNSPHLKHTQEALQQLRDLLKVPPRPEALLPWLLSQNRNTVTSLLAAVAVYTVDAVQGREGEHASDKLLEALDIDMANYWQPTADTFFGIVPRAMGLQAVGEAFDAKHPAAARLLAGPAQGKTEFAGAAEEAMARSGWLPKPLRRPGYLPRTKVAAASAEKAKPKLKASPTKKAAAAKAKPNSKKAITKKAPAKKVPAKKAKTPAAKAPAKKATKK
jgi:ParB family chromosome partitioning protein